MKLKKIFTLSMLAAAAMLTACGNVNDIGLGDKNPDGPGDITIPDNPDNSGGNENEQENLNIAKQAAKLELEAFMQSEIEKAGKIDDGSVLAQVNLSKEEIDKQTTLATISSTKENEKVKILQKINALATPDTTDYNKLKNSAKTELDAYKVQALATSNKVDNGTVLKAYNDGLDLIDGAKNDVDDIALKLSQAKLLIDNAIKALPQPEPSQGEFSYIQGLNETIALEWNDSNISNAKVYYKSSNDSNYIKIDNELVRDYSHIARADILGLPKGTYSVKVEKGDGTGNIIKNNIEVFEQDRSGYGHFKAERALGAYENNGKLKENAKVVYVNDSNKNTVKATINGKACTGIVEIIQNATNKNESLNIRILGTVKTAQWNKISHGTGKTSQRQQNLENTFKYTETESYWNKTISGSYDRLYMKDILALNINKMSNDEAAGITNINNLTGFATRTKDPKSYGYEYDSYWNEIDVVNGENITVEGVGYDAGFYQLGFSFKKSSYVEVKNLRFDSYTEDACAFEGVSDEGKNATSAQSFTTGHIWVHNNTFEMGKNNWDITYENDKNEGDGSTDIKCLAYQTLSYNRYNKTHKTGLVGGSDSQRSSSITYHHNYYNNCGSRLPYGRQANMHMYNNYYYKSTGTNMQIYAGANAFIENSYFESVNKPMELKTSDGKKPAAKLFNNTFVDCTGTNGGTVVTNRTQSVDNNCLFGKNFDTDSNLFYYDSAKKASDVLYMTSSEQAKADTIKFAGNLKGNATPYPTTQTNVTPEPSEPTPDVPVNPNEIIATYTNNIPTTSGFYARVLDGNNSDLQLSDQNTVKIINDKINVIDTDSNSTTFGYYMFDNPIERGIVEYNLTFQIAATGSKWNMVQFMDGNKNICIRSCGIDTGDKGKVGYMVDGASETVVLQQTFVKDTDYNVTLRVNYDLNKAYLVINGTEVEIKNYNVSKISGVCYQTAKSAIDRNITSSIPTMTSK